MPYLFVVKVGQERERESGGQEEEEENVKEKARKIKAGQA
jgi:hypothetical protein